MESMDLQTDVLVIGSGAAGMVAAKAASAEGAKVILADKSVVGRGGATVLAQMTVAAALGEAEEDHPDIHFEDTMKGSRGLADPDIVRAIVDRAPELINELEGYGVKWARTAEGIRSQVVAPGHSRRRCVYVDILNTGGATSAGLRKAIWKEPNIKRLKNVMITKIVVQDGRAAGAIGFAFEQMKPVRITAKAIILATGGLTEMYARNSASANMTGDGFVLAAEAGAELRDMEMVQFFPIAHLHPPLVGLDPIMWDPFRYKLGGRLLNGLQEEFMDKYNNEVSGVYTAARDQTTFAIFSEVKAGRGSPHGGAYLDFRMVPEQKLKEAFGPVIDILARQGVDLTRDMVEVAPMAHFTMGGVKVSPRMETTVPGLYACGELIYGMHGANRLSGNALTEAFVTGRIAGEQAAGAKELTPWPDAIFDDEFERLRQFWHPREVLRDDVPMLALKIDGEIGQQLIEKANAKGMKFLGFWEIGFRHFTNSKVEIVEPADMAGLKIRVQPSKVWDAHMAALKANGVPLGFNELYSAMDQGVVDGQENPLNTIYSMKFYEVQKYLSLTGHTYSPGAVAMSTKAWESLSAEQQQIVTDDFKEAQLYQREELAKINANILEEIKEKGVVVTEPNIEAFRELTKDVRNVLTEEVPPELIAQIESIR